ncbi:MAG TPA: FMN-binding protein [Thermoguttaceae bacterium]|nr:FMN-binding protein [Thermoguttaceae bacterium]
MTETPKKGNYIGQAWLVILLATLYGGALAGVQTTLGPIIEENKRNETYDVIPRLVEGADKAKTVEVRVTGLDGKPTRVYQANTTDEGHVGWVLPGTGLGFADRIDLLIGLGPQLTTITGIYVLDQKETPGLGNYITEDSFQQQFVGKRTDRRIGVVKTDPMADANEIRALSGATISSESVARIVNQTIANLKEAIAAHGEQSNHD